MEGSKAFLLQPLPDAGEHAHQGPDRLQVATDSSDSWGVQSLSEQQQQTHLYWRRHNAGG